MPVRPRISYPAVYDLNDVILLVKLLQRASLPLSVLCNNVNISNRYRPKLISWRTKHGLNSDVITLASILGFVNRRRVIASDANIRLPNIDVPLREVLKRTPQTLVINLLSKTGIELSVSKSAQYMLFEAILSNKKLPPYFARTLQCKRLYDASLSIVDLEEELHITSGGKRPEAKCLVKWLRFFGVNLETGTKTLLDKGRAFHMVLYCLKNRIESLLLGSREKPFAELRSQALSDFNLLPTFPFDDMFEILLRSQPDGTFSFRGGREQMVGGWKAQSAYAFVGLTKEMEMPDAGYVSSLVNRLDIEMGV
jgi:hypothetical protein